MKLKFLFLFFFFLIIFSVVYSDEDISSKFKKFILSSTFGDSRNDHFHTGIDLSAPLNTPISALEDCELVFYNKNEKNGIRYGNGIFAIYDGTESKIRYNFSHLSDEKKIDDRVMFKQGDIVGYVGNSGYSTGPHLHLETEDILEKKDINPLHFLNFTDTKSPKIEDVYFITEQNKKLSLYLGNKNTVIRGGKLFIQAYDLINNSRFKLAPYKITIFIDGVKKEELVFNYLYKNNNNLFCSNGNDFDRIYSNKLSNDYYLMDYYTLPGIVGLQILVEDFTGNKTYFHKNIRVTLK